MEYSYKDVEKLMFCLFHHMTEGEVPRSAVLIFNIELVELIPGLPDGYMFIWNGEVSPNLFEEIDKDQNGEIFLQEVCVRSSCNYYELLITLCVRQGFSDIR